MATTLEQAHQVDDARTARVGTATKVTVGDEHVPLRPDHRWLLLEAPLWLTDRFERLSRDRRGELATDMLDEFERLLNP